MTNIPSKTSLTGGAVTEGEFKTGIDNLIDALNERLEWGSSGSTQTAVLLAKGTAAAPGAAISEEDQGLFSPSTGTLGLSIGGAEVLRVTTASYIGVGTTNVDAKLHVSIGNSTTPAVDSNTVALFQNIASTSNDAYISVISGKAGKSGLYMGDQDDQDVAKLNYDNANNALCVALGGTERFRIVNSNGRVGVGSVFNSTFTPASRLHVVTGAGANTTHPGGAVVVAQNNSAVSDNAYIDIISGTSANAELRFGSTLSDRGRVAYDNSANELALWTNGSNRVTITSTGGVGVGTTAPGAKFAVASGNMLVDNNNVYQGKNSGGTAVDLLKIDGSNNVEIANASGNKVVVGTGGSVQFHSTSGEGARLSSAGNFGINAPNPQSQLHVGLATEDFEVVDAGSASATEQDWIEVQIGGVTGYIRVYASK